MLHLEAETQQDRAVEAARQTKAEHRQEKPQDAFPSHDSPTRDAAGAPRPPSTGKIPL